MVLKWLSLLVPFTRAHHIYANNPRSLIIGTLSVSVVLERHRQEPGVAPSRGRSMVGDAVVDTPETYYETGCTTIIGTYQMWCRIKGTQMNALTATKIVELCSVVSKIF